MTDTNLRIPGPTPVPPQVLAAMARPMINHRGPEFKALLSDVLAGLRPIFGTTGDVLIFPAASTGGMEAAIVNTLSPGDRVLTVSVGYFGDRFANIAAAFGADVVSLTFPWGQAADPAAVGEALRADASIKAVLLTHNETSTGVTNDLSAVAEVVAAAREDRPGLLLIVDAVSSLAALPICADALGLDVVVSGSQKALMVPPGLAVVSVSQRAWEASAHARMPRYYWDWAAARSAQQKGETPYTPSLPLLFGLSESLRMIHTEGLQSVFARHGQLGQVTRAGVQAVGLSLFADPAVASDTVTAARVPAGVDGKKLLAGLRERHGVVLAGGQGPVEGKIIRIGHLGWVGLPEIMSVFGALEAVLSDLGWPTAAGQARPVGDQLPTRR